MTLPTGSSGGGARPDDALLTSTLVISLHDRPGALDRVVGLVRRNGCDVVRLAHGPGERPGLARTTITIAGANATRLSRQLGRLVDVVSFSDASPPPRRRDTTLLRLEVPADRRDTLLSLAEALGARVSDDEARIPFHFQADGMSVDDPNDTPED